MALVGNGLKKLSYRHELARRLGDIDTNYTNLHEFVRRLGDIDTNYTNLHEGWAISTRIARICTKVGRYRHELHEFARRLGDMDTNYANLHEGWAIVANCMDLHK